jgi:hypothetical protein
MSHCMASGDISGQVDRVPGLQPASGIVLNTEGAQYCGAVCAYHGAGLRTWPQVSSATYGPFSSRIHQRSSGRKVALKHQAPALGSALRY